MQWVREEMVGQRCNLKPWAYAVGDGFTIRGQRSEPSGKPLIHFLHGNGFCGLTYWPFLSRLLPEYDLFLHDIQGHGESDVGDCFLGWNGNADLVYQVWQKYRGDYAGLPVIGAGHSLGGVLTALIAAKQRQCFKALVLLDPVIFPPQMLWVMQAFKLLGLRSPNPLVKRTLNRRNVWSSQEEAKRHLAGKGMFKGWDDSALNAHVCYALKTEDAHQVTLKCPPFREAEIFASFPENLWSSLKSIEQPTSVIYGDRTYRFVRQSAGKLTAKNPLIKTQQFPGGHCFMQEQPADSVVVVKREIASLFN